MSVENNKTQENSLMKKTTQMIGVMLIGGLLAVGTVSTSYAAEDAGGVTKYIGLSLDSAKAAVEAAKAKDKAKTIESLKQVRQQTKEITGDAAGMKLQKVNQAVKQAKGEADNELFDKVIETMTPAVAALEEIKNGAK
jgi:hypothetical protein